MKNFDIKKLFSQIVEKINPGKQTRGPAQLFNQIKEKIINKFAKQKNEDKKVGEKTISGEIPKTDSILSNDQTASELKTPLDLNTNTNTNTNEAKSPSPDQTKINFGPFKNIERKKFFIYLISILLVIYLVFDELFPTPPIVEVPVVNKRPRFHKHNLVVQNKNKMKTTREELIEKNVINEETKFDEKKITENATSTSSLSKDDIDHTQLPNVDLGESMNLPNNEGSTTANDDHTQGKKVDDIITPNVSSVLDISSSIKSNPETNSNRDTTRDPATTTPVEKIQNQTSDNATSNNIHPDLDILKDMNDSIKSNNKKNLLKDKDLKNQDENTTDQVNLPTSKVTNNLNQKIEGEIIEEIPTPNYQAAGRGLIYNCEQKYWACVNQEEYFRCIKSETITSKFNLTSKCAVDSVYSTNDDCQRAQLDEINNKNTNIKELCKR